MEFIMDEQLEKIHHEKTKEYVKEVISCYKSGNYRASVVLLYSAVIYDLLEKMVLLKEIYKEESAKKILISIKNKQKQRPTDSRWEAEFIENICKETQIITEVEKNQLLNLKSERNYAAHPIFYFDINDKSSIEKIEIKMTTKETAKDLIRKAFEIVFLKDTILAKDILNDLLRDTNDYYCRLELSGLEAFIKTRYYNRMTQERKDRVFRSLWQIVFVTNDKECNDNRVSNYHTLQYLYRENPTHYQDIIKKEETHYFDKLELDTFIFDKEINIHTQIYNFKNSRIMMLIRFIENNSDIYTIFNTFSKNIIENVVKNSYLKNNILVEKFNDIKDVDRLEDRFGEQLKLIAECVFLSKNVKEHFENINTMIENYILGYDYKYNYRYSVLCDESLIESIEGQVEKEEFIEFLIKYCLKARSYEQADKLFKLIEKYILNFSKNNFYTCLLKMNSNSQFYDNNNIYNHINFLKKKFKEMFGLQLIENPIEHYLYPNLFKNDLQSFTDFISKLDILEQRVMLYDDINDLGHIAFFSGIRTLNKKYFIENYEEKYKNILKKLSDFKEYSYLIEEFKCIFEKDKENEY